MAWLDARAAIATVLEGVSITSPTSETVKKAYTTPPGTIQDVPCFIIYPPAVDVDRGFSRREKIYTVRCLLLVKDADLDVAADLADAYREATIDAFDVATSLGGEGVISHQRCEEAAGFKYANKEYTGFYCILTLTINEAKAFAAG